MKRQFINPATSLLALLAFFGGCTAMPTITEKTTLVLKPEFRPGSHTQAELPPYTQSSISHLTLRLYVAPAQPTGIEKDLLGAQLGNPVVISNLKPNTTYRIKAFAYDSGNALISTDDEYSYTDVTVTDSDRPAVNPLVVKLIDRSFNAQASSSLVVQPGGYSPIGTESLQAAYWVSTVAGSDSTNLVDAVGVAASFNLPHGLARDSQGNLYICDYSHHCIRKMSPFGMVTTFAGSGTAGYLDANGLSAQFTQPVGVDVDAGGTVYVADSFNHRIRKITPSGTVSTVAGSGSTGFQDGTGTQAIFDKPYGVVVDAGGGLYVTDGGNNRIRKITPTGVVTTLAGDSGTGTADGQGTQARFSNPVGLVLDSAQNIYVTDGANNRIRKITPTGMVSTIAGSASGLADGTGTQAKFYNPMGITIDDDNNLFVVDRGNNCVRKITSLGLVSTLAGNGSAGTADGIGTLAKFNTPFGIVLGPDGNLYVSDINSHRIRKMR